MVCHLCVNDPDRLALQRTTAHRGEVFRRFVDDPGRRATGRPAVTMTLGQRLHRQTIAFLACIDRCRPDCCGAGGQGTSCCQGDGQCKAEKRETKHRIAAVFGLSKHGRLSFAGRQGLMTQRQWSIFVPSQPASSSSAFRLNWQRCISSRRLWLFRIGAIKLT